jgi:hypothetical protein
MSVTGLQPPHKLQADFFVLQHLVHLLPHTVVRRVRRQRGAAACRSSCGSAAARPPWQRALC